MAGSSYLSRALGADVANRITHSETHHQSEDDEPPVPTRGRVESIEAAYWDLAPRPGDAQRIMDQRIMYPVEGTSVLEPRTTADGWEPERTDGREFEGYIVTLTHCAENAREAFWGSFGNTGAQSRPLARPTNRR